MCQAGLSSSGGSVSWLRTSAVTSCPIPNDGPPTSSQARAIPTRKQTTTRIGDRAAPRPGRSELVTITARARGQLDHERGRQAENRNSRVPRGRATAPGPGSAGPAGPATAATPRRTPAPRIGHAPPRPTPILCPGNQGEQRHRQRVGERRQRRRRAHTVHLRARPPPGPAAPEATEMATNNSPISAPATPAEATKKSLTLSGTTRRFCQARRLVAVRGRVSWPMASSSATAWAAGPGWRMRCSAQVGHRRGAGDQQHVGERWSSQASATCIGVAPSRAATSVRVAGLQGAKPPSGK